MSDTFDPSKHLRRLRGKGGDADYLDVKWRIVWLRHEHPEAIIITEKVAGGMEANYAEFTAKVIIPGGGSATGYGSETKADFGDFIEKAETKALGRAIAALGYGTQFVGNELDEGERIVDSPVKRKPEDDDGHAAAQPYRPPANQGVVLYEPANPPARTARTPSPPSDPRPAVAPLGGGPPPYTDEDVLLATIRNDLADPKERKRVLHAYYTEAETVMELNRRADTVAKSGLPEADMKAAYRWHHNRLSMELVPAATKIAG